MLDNTIKTFVNIINVIDKINQESRQFEDIIGSVFVDFQGFLKIGQRFEEELIEIAATLFSENDDDLASNIDWIEWYLYEKPSYSENNYNVKIDSKEYNIQTPEDLAFFLKYNNN